MMPAGADPQRWRAIEQAARTPAQIAGEAEPGLLSGAISGTVKGVGVGIAQVDAVGMQAIGSVYQPLLNAQDWMINQVFDANLKSTNPFYKARDEALSLAQRMRPDPLTTGVVGNVMFDVARTLTQVGLGAAVTAATGGAGGAAMLGGAATTGVATGYATYTDPKLIKGGVDASTRANMAFFDGLFTGAGVALPASIGVSGLAAPFAAVGVGGVSRASYYAANAAYGVGSNIAMGVSQRGMSYDLLMQGGYKSMAQQYAPLDSAAITAEGILGLAFSTLGARAGAPLRWQPHVDAALAARDAKHALADTAPGLPADPATANAHNDALETAARQLINGEPVNVADTGVTEGNFVLRPRDETVVEALREQEGGLPGEIPSMTAEDWRAELAARQDVPEDLRAAVGQRFEQGERVFPGFARDLQEIAASVGGRAVIAPLKTVARAVSKVVSDYAGNASRIRDLVRATVEIKALDDVNGVLAQLRQRYGEPANLRNNLTTADNLSPDGYRDINSVWMVNGEPVEVQINVPEMLAAKEKAHPLYVQRAELARKIDSENRVPTSEEKARMDALDAQQSAIYQAALETAIRRMKSSREINSASSRNTLDENLLPSGQDQAIWPSSQANEPSGMTPKAALAEGAGRETGGSEVGIKGTSRDSIISDDPETRMGLAILDEQGDLVVPIEREDGTIENVSLREQLAQADAELQYANKNTIDAAVACFLRRGV
jgi:hypothetical protein